MDLRVRVWNSDAGGAGGCYTGVMTFEIVVTGAWAQRKQLDARLESCLQTGWSLARCGFLLRACLRAGAFELAGRTDVPVSVVISEYVEVARLFLDGDEPKFVNAVLDRLAPQLRDGVEAAG